MYGRVCIQFGMKRRGEKLPLDCGLASREDETVEGCVDIMPFADLENLCAQFRQSELV